MSVKLLNITHRMIDANGILRGVNFSRRENLEDIYVKPEVKSLTIEADLFLPQVTFSIGGATDITIKGDVYLTSLLALDIMTLSKAAKGKLTVLGSLQTHRSVLINGTIHVTGSIHAGDTLHADGSIYCNGAIHAELVEAMDEIVVDDTIKARKIACRKLTIYSDQPMPAIDPPRTFVLP